LAWIVLDIAIKEMLADYITSKGACPACISGANLIAANKESSVASASAQSHVLVLIGDYTTCWRCYDCAVIISVCSHINRHASIAKHAE
jgi:hypothetical protein